jgi:hypothetical protein
MHFPAHESEPVHVLPLQHGLPATPQVARQVPPLHVSFVPQVVVLPVTQLPFWHRSCAWAWLLSEHRGPWRQAELFALFVALQS